jgi:hypothetical protein
MKSVDYILELYIKVLMADLEPKTDHERQEKE